MQIDPSQRSAPDNYKLLTNPVVPHPIAWVTSQNADGVINLAPLSFFNAVGGNPFPLSLTLWVKQLAIRLGCKQPQPSTPARGSYAGDLQPAIGWTRSSPPWLCQRQAIH
jgi:hypothetical protein